jgi:putative membrane protein
MMGWYGGAFPLMWMGMGLFWLALIGVIVWLVVQIARPGTARGVAGPTPPAWPQAAAGGAESPLDVLDRRLAAGEVDLATYREARAALLGSRGGKP